jgi:hypothetical protein
MAMLPKALPKTPMTFITEIEKVNTQGNTEQKEQHWRFHNIRLQTILHSHSNKNSMVLAQKQM